MTDDDPLAATVRDALVAAARERRTLTYNQLVELAPEAASNLAPVLRAISVDADEHGQGLLTALVVRDDTGLPGTGFFTLAAGRGRDVTDRRHAWEAEVATVYAAFTD